MKNWDQWIEEETVLNGKSGVAEELDIEPEKLKSLQRDREIQKFFGASQVNLAKNRSR
jgi:hypothetical protein